MKVRTSPSSGGAAEVIDLEMFRLSTDHVAPLPPDQSARPPVPQMKVIEGEFLSGPIRMDWLERAAMLKGAAFKVAVLIRHLHNMRRPDPVVLSNIQASRLGVSASAKGRAVKLLAEAGLIRVEQNDGCAPRVIPIGDR